MTHPRVLARPLSREQIAAFGDALLASRSLQVLTETERHRDFFQQCLRELPEGAANLAHDAHLVALMHEHGVAETYTADTDFHRLAGITVVNPLR